MRLLTIAYAVSRKRRVDNQGFTLIELLVVVIIMGILSAMALPSMLGQTSKAKQSEAKNTLGSVTRTQVAYRTENSTFAPSMEALALGLPLKTNDYIYEVISTPEDGDVSKGSPTIATITATPRDVALKGYTGGNVLYQASTGGTAIATVMCENKAAGITKPALPQLDPSQKTPELAARCDSTQERL